MKDPLIGHQFANFRIERLLGHGGMATVYYGEDVKLHRPVAVKFLDRRYKNNPSFSARFVNEARMMAAWRHEHIIQIYYADDTRSYSYYAMEYIDGSDLAQVMSAYEADGELMPIEDVLRIGSAVASALDYAHKHRIIHRDIKPSNILIALDSRVLIGDFGLALDVRDGSTGNIFGTPHYISPEQAKRSADAVPQSDLYSLGVILYELLTGSVPFNDPSPASVALQHIAEPPPPPRKFNPDLSPGVEKVLLKALEKNPKERYQTGAQLMAALKDAIHPASAPEKIPLPPLPVGVPNVLARSSKTISQMSRRATKTRQKNAQGQPDDRFEDTYLEPPFEPGESTRRSGWDFSWLSWAWIPILLLLLMWGLYSARGSILQAIPLRIQTHTPEALPLNGVNAGTDEPAAPTETLLPPSAVPTVTVSVTSTSLPLPTVTSPPTFTAVPATVTPPQFIGAEPTVKYPDGFHFVLYWNETSFVMRSDSDARRTLSAFSFQRLDANDEPLDEFVGYYWETGRFKYIPTNLCVRIALYEVQDPPYLVPSECILGFLSTYQIPSIENSTLIFWTAEEGSTQFRALWLGEEVARCEIQAGICDIYVPRVQ